MFFQQVVQIGGKGSLDPEKTGRAGQVEERQKQQDQECHQRGITAPVENVANAKDGHDDNGDRARQQERLEDHNRNSSGDNRHCVFWKLIDQHDASYDIRNGDRQGQ